MTCTVKYARASSSSLRWRLMHGGYAVSHGNTSAVRLEFDLGYLCKGRYVLYVQGKKMKDVVIGTTSYNLAAGTSKTVKVKITNNQVKKELNKGQTIRAQVSGLGIKTSTVKLRPSKSKKR